MYKEIFRYRKYIMYFFIWFLLSPIFTFQINKIPKYSVLFVGKKRMETEVNMEKKNNITKSDIDLFLERIKIKEKENTEEIWDSGEVEWEL